MVVLSSASISRFVVHNVTGDGGPGEGEPWEMRKTGLWEEREVEAGENAQEGEI